MTAAKTADELLTLSGIHASFVLFKNGTGVEPSQRDRSVRSTYSSLWKNSAAAATLLPAGGQVADASVDEVRARLLNAIDEYMEE